MCSKNCRCIDCKNNQEFNKKHEPKKLSIEFIRVEVKQANLTVKEGKILFVRTETIKHSTNQLPKINNEEIEGKSIMNNYKSNFNSGSISFVKKKLSDDTSRIETLSKASNSSNNIVNSKETEAAAFRDDKVEKIFYLQKKRMGNYNINVDHEDIENEVHEKTNDSDLRLKD